MLGGFELYPRWVPLSCNVGMLVLTVDPRVFSPGTLETSVSKFQFYS